jgi:hypothetical protein
MDTKNWKFVKDGLDDFRDGLPPSHDNIIIEVNFFSSFILILLFSTSLTKVQVRQYSLKIVE